MSLKVEIEFTLNGRPARAEIAANASALGMLRESFDLAGAKLACGEGECGACTVLVDGLSVNSCLMPAVDCEGRTVETVEGVGDADGLDPVQDAFVEYGAVQCGYCTPGMVMQAKYLLSRNPNPTDAEIARFIEGNVCRCTGYRKIIDAISAVSRGKGS
ncbi:MAG: (2Fe-2S)-binding protein [Alphaproteobacteria bacterium]